MQYTQLNELRNERICYLDAKITDRNNTFYTRKTSHLHTYPLLQFFTIDKLNLKFWFKVARIFLKL